MIWSQTRKLFRFGFCEFLLLVSFGPLSLHAEGLSNSQLWKSCQSGNAEERLSGCTAIIKSEGSGSQSRLSDALDARCWAYHVKGEFVLAIDDCRASIKIRPKYSYAYNNLGAAYLGMGDFANAITVLNKAIELKPNYFWSRLNRAKAYVATGKKREALRDYQFALELQPQNGEVKEALRMLAESDGGALSSPVSGNPKPMQSETSPSIPPPTNSAMLSALQPRAPSALGRRIALVIGNAIYQNAPVLSNPQRDALLVADALKRTGFQTVTLQTNLGREALITALRNFAQQSQTAAPERLASVV
jgi:tetratricopeptide (TPR) repeat protein